MTENHLLRLLSDLHKRSPHKINITIFNRQILSSNMAIINNEQEQQLVDVKKTTRLSPKPKRSVSFFPNAKGRLTMHIGEYTEEEIAACWYTKNEYRGFKTEACFTVNFLESKHDIGVKNYCKRGLEPFTRAGAKLLARNRDKAYRAVFREQIIQDSEDKTNEVLLSNVYQQASQQARLSARLTGLSDEKEARDQEESNVDATNKSGEKKSKKRTRSFVRTCRRHLPSMRFSLQ